ncbi:MAG: response regulator [Anaeromyxobacteraceae bacterium]
MSKGILLVDDDPGLRDALGEALEIDGHRVETAVHGADALAKLAAGARPDLILLDLMMPVMDGWQFRAAQLAHPDYASIPVIVITAAGVLKQQIDTCRILRKPFRMEELFQAIAEVEPPLVVPSGQIR